MSTQTQAVRGLARGARLLERSCPEVHLAHYRVLAAVASGDERASRVAERLAVGKPTVTAAVDALCAKGLLVREAVAGDQRAAALTLTDDGRALLLRADREMGERLAAVAGRTPDPGRVLEALGWLDAAITADLEARRR